MMSGANRPERPRLEPEIIPPGLASSAWGNQRWPNEPHSFDSTSGVTYRIHIARLGPVAVALLLLLMGVIGVAILLTVVGVVLVWIPLVALLAGIGMLYRLLRR
jgi:hypothetical protein